MAVRRGLAISLLVLVAACAAAAGPSLPSSDGVAQAQAASRPNVIFILTDDLSWDLVRYMPNVRRMQRDGMTFNNYFVTNSLCCPSRASIFTGLYPHNHGVLTNTAPIGGFSAFTANAESETFATALQGSGYPHP
jgi:arylsulfatase A-like enzyme